MNKALITAALIASSMQAAQAADVDAGKELVNENCYACHGNEIYTRKDRIVNSRSSLTQQVQRCELALGLQWFEDDVENSAEYLNLKFYHFGKK